MKKDYPDIQALENEKWQDPDPATGKLGTRVPAKWLQNTEDSIKSLTNEMLEVLSEAGINADELNNTQLLAALKKIINADTKIKPITEGGTGASTAAAARTNLGLKSSATLDKTDNFGTSANLVATQLLVDKLRAELIDATSEPVGKLHFIDDSVVPKGLIEYAGQAIDRVKMPKLFEKYGEIMPNYRDRVARAANGPLGGVAGSTQEDAMQKITGSAGFSADGFITLATGVFARETGFKGRYNIAADTGAPGSWSSKVLYDNSTIARTSSETRVKAFFALICTKIQ